MRCLLCWFGGDCRFFSKIQNWRNWVGIYYHACFPCCWARRKSLVGCKRMCINTIKACLQGESIQVSFSSEVSEGLGIFSNWDLHSPSVRQTRAPSIDCVLITLSNNITFQYVLCMCDFKYVHMSASTCGSWAVDPQ